jgi:hypothetical protein
VGTSGVAGTGPWVLESKVTTLRTYTPAEVATAGPLAEDEVVREIRFKRWTQHWDTRAGGNLHSLVVRVFPDINAVHPAVVSGDVGMVFGLDTLNPLAFRELHQVSGRWSGTMRLYQKISSIPVTH